MARSQIKYGAIISYFAIFVNIAISLIYTPWMIRQIGVSDFGLYSLVTTFLSYFLLDFGLANTVTRFLARYRAEGNQDKVNNLFGLVAKVYVLFDAFVFIVIFTLFFFIADIFGGLTPKEIDKLKILYCICGAFSVMNFVFKPLRGAMAAYEQFIANKTIELIQHIGTVLLIIIALLLDGDIFSLVFINGAVGFIAAIVRYIIFFHRTKAKINWAYYDRKELIDVTSFSGWIMMNQISQMLRITLVPTILGIVSNTTEIAIFGVGRNLVGFIWTISAALNGLFMPRVTRLVHQDNMSEVHNLMVRVGRLQLYVMQAIFLGFLVFGDIFISLWVGDKFHNAYYVFLFIVFSNLIAHTLSVASDVVYARNAVRDTAKKMFSSSVLGLIISLCVASKYGALGCSLATGLALTLTQLQYVIYYHRRLGLDMVGFFKERHLSIMPVFVALAAFFMFAKPYILQHSWFSLVLWGSIFVVMYCLIAYFFVMNESEKDLIWELMGKRKKQNK